MKVALVIPPSVFLADERVFVSLGVLKVAAALLPHHDVDVLDLSGIDNYLDVMRDYCLASRPAPAAIGLTVTTPQLPAVERLVRAIRETAAPCPRLMLGGPHVTVTLAACKRDPAGRAQAALRSLRALADVLVAGDGEEAVFSALAEEAPPIVDADEPASPLFLTSSRLEAQPWPARHLVDLGSYRYAIDGKPATSVVMQLGCPYGCAFCAGRRSPSFRRIRTRSIGQVIAELRHLHDTYGYEAFQFYDDELNVNPAFLQDLEALARFRDALGVDLRFRGFLKANLVTEPQVRAMRAAGFRQVCVGFESGADRILTNIRKQATRDQNTRCVELAHRQGLAVKALMSLGHAGETEATVRATQEWLLAVQPEDFDCTIITPYPGSPYYDDAVPLDAGLWRYTAANGDHLYSYDVDFTAVAQYYKGLRERYVSYVFTDALSAEELVRLRDEVEIDVRTKLGLRFYEPAPAQRYERSMGQMGPLPTRVFQQALACR